ncbi:hypothetical protein B4U80_14340 [Leptotrombidium deliense]|uniref:Serpin domain-containing protein n=1 Tax=Leptotrombidium deliense TaxID=299467 RepID=A0A443RX88_9ACAR|nr:hypothetical protein B4U80_14340 [Leptotrombidium deliense]
MTTFFVNITIPKLRIFSENTADSFKLNKDLYRICSYSPLTNFTDVPGLQMTTMTMTNMFEINEHGIKYELLISSALERTAPSKNAVFNCNRPFLFFVSSKREKIALLAGVIDEVK